MANDKQKSNGNKKSTVVDKIADHPGLATAAGAVIGATVVAAGVMVLKNDKTREKAEKVLDTLGDKAVEFAENMKEDAKAQLNEKTTETVEEVKKVAQ